VAAQFLLAQIAAFRPQRKVAVISFRRAAFAPHGFFSLPIGSDSAPLSKSK
jgi:hypothetical protein